MMHMPTFDFLRRRKRSYQLMFPKTCFGSPAMKDLMKFCRFGKTVFHEDERMTFVLLGRQEVMTRIIQHLNLPTEELYAMFGGPDVQQLGGEDG